MNFLIHHRVSVILLAANVFSLVALFVHSVSGKTDPKKKSTTETDNHTFGLLGVHNAGPAEILVTVTYTMNNETVTRDAKLMANSARKFSIPLDATTNGIKIEEWEVFFSVPLLGQVVIPYRKVILEKGFPSPTQECYRISGTNFQMKYAMMPCSDVIDYA